MALYRLLTGIHIGRGGKHWKAGDIIESKTDLVKFGGPEKFAYVHEKAKATVPAVFNREETKPEPEPVVEPETDADEPPEEAAETEAPDFDSFTLAELKKYATDNGIDTNGLKTKADYLEALKGQ
jgi:hypothetical protein